MCRFYRFEFASMLCKDKFEQFLAKFVVTRFMFFTNICIFEFVAEKYDIFDKFTVVYKEKKEWKECTFSM